MSRCTVCGQRVAEADKPEHVRVCITPAQDEYAQAERRAIQELENEEARLWRQDIR